MRVSQKLIVSLYERERETEMIVNCAWESREVIVGWREFSERFARSPPETYSATRRAASVLEIRVGRVDELK